MIIALDRNFYHRQITTTSRNYDRNFTILTIDRGLKNYLQSFQNNKISIVFEISHKNTNFKIFIKFVFINLIKLQYSKVLKLKKKKIL